VNVLAVGAHPDDLEQLCAGTLIKYALPVRGSVRGGVPVSYDLVACQTKAALALGRFRP
jgi:LmbE family N-acetylglucosaminyl deacetylase